MKALSLLRWTQKSYQGFAGNESEVVKLGVVLNGVESRRVEDDGSQDFRQAFTRIHRQTSEKAIREKFVTLRQS